MRETELLGIEPKNCAMRGIKQTLSTWSVWQASSSVRKTGWSSVRVTGISRRFTLISGRRLTFVDGPHAGFMEVKDLKVRAAGLEKRWGTRDADDNPKSVEFETLDSERTSLIGRQLNTDLAVWAPITR